MPIYTNSRYQFSTVDYLSTTEYGDPKPIVFYSPDDLSSVTYTVHTFSQGETLHYLSWRYYGRPDFWWAIVEHNPQIVDFFNLSAGAQIRIPRV